MAIELVRIDDRLVHGQVVTTWSKHKQIEQIIVINDAVSNDSLQKSILKMSAPAGIKVKVFGIEKFINIMKTNTIKHRTLLLFTTSTDVLKVLEGDVKFDYLNVGGMRFNESRTRYTRAVSMTKKEVNDFHSIINKGVEVIIQMVPKDPPVTMKSVLEGSYNE